MARFQWLFPQTEDSREWLVLAEFKNVIPAKYNLTSDDYPLPVEVMKQASEQTTALACAVVCYV